MWTGETAMKEFMTSGAHGKAMRKLVEWCDEAAVVHWTQESAALPSWAEAYQRLQKDGRRSKVNHPSAGHLAHEFPAPPEHLRSELGFKSPFKLLALQTTAFRIAAYARRNGAVGSTSAR
jgi:hypothetical protein